MVPTGSFSSRFFYDIYIDKISIKPTSQKYFDRLFGPDLIRDKIYTLPHLATVDACTRIFQFKVSHNTLFLNSRLVHLGFSATPFCSLYNVRFKLVVHQYPGGVGQGLLLFFSKV